MKYEWRKEEKELYIPKNIPTLIEIPKQSFFTIEGIGNPNTKEFQERIEVLYSLSYAVRMMPKNGFTPEGYFEYTVYPLEGVWDLTDKGRTLDTLDKDELVYKIMIRQPDFVDNEVVEKAFEIAKRKNPTLLLDKVRFEEIEDGLCVQMLHIGSFDDEPKSFELMKKFIEENNYTRRVLTHKEIYLSDFRKVEKDKLKTVLRYFIK